jgi:hypothetical protein
VNPNGRCFLRFFKEGLSLENHFKAHYIYASILAQIGDFQIEPEIAKYRWYA